jgi:hypothetical protein
MVRIAVSSGARVIAPTEENATRMVVVNVTKDTTERIALEHTVQGIAAGQMAFACRHQEYAIARATLPARTARTAQTGTKESTATNRLVPMIAQAGGCALLRSRVTVIRDGVVVTVRPITAHTTVQIVVIALMGCVVAGRAGRVPNAQSRFAMEDSPR